MQTREEKIAFLKSRQSANDGISIAPKTREEKIAFLRARSEPSSDAPTAIESGVRGLAQGGMAGFLDEASGVVEGAGRLVGLRGLGGNFSDIEVAPEGPSWNRKDLKNAYKEGRDRKRAMLREDSEVNPGVSGASQFVGGFVSPANKLVKGASFVKAGAGLGALNAAGSTEADNLGDAATDIATGAALGGGLGWAGQKASPYISKGAENAGNLIRSGATKAGEKLSEVAEVLAVKSAEADLKTFRAFEGQGRVRELGRWMIEKGAIKRGGSLADVAAKAKELKLAAGDKLDEVYSTAQKAFGDKLDGIGFDPIRDKQKILSAAREELGQSEGAGKALSRLGNYLDEVAARHGDIPNDTALKNYRNEVAEYLPKFRIFLKEKGNYQKAFGRAADDLNQPVLDGMSDDLQRGVQKAGEAPSIGGPSGQTQMVFRPEAPARPVRPQEVRNPMSPRQTNEVKSALDDTINYSRNPLSKEPVTEKAFVAARRQVAKQVDEAIESLGGDKLLKDLKLANKDYGNATQVARMATDRLSRNNTNRMFGLTDYITGGAATTYGAVTGDWQTAAGIMAAKKVGDKFGVQGATLLADRISKQLLQNPKAASIAQNSPEVFKGLVARISGQISNQPQSTSLPRAADQEGDALQARPLKGEDKWASDGFENIQKASGEKFDKGAMLEDKKLKRLLIEASGLKPNSKAMASVLARIKAAQNG